MKSLAKLAVIILVIVALGVLGHAVLEKTKAEEAALPKPKAYAVVVSTFTPAKRDIRVTLPFLAMVKNDEDVTLSSKIAARIIAMKTSGSRVKKRDVIVRLDATTIRTNVRTLRAQVISVDTALKNMKSTHRRTLTLVAAKGASVEQGEREENNIAALTSRRAALREKLYDLRNNASYAKLVSPVSGVISSTMLHTGDMAMPGHPIATIHADQGFYLLVRVPVGLKIYGVMFRHKHYDAISLNSTFRGLAEYKVYVDSVKLTSGDRITIDVEVFNGKSQLLPFDSVLNRAGKSYALQVQGKRAKATQIHIVQSGEQGIVTDSDEILGKAIVVAKQDILLKLLSGASLKVKSNK